MYKIIGVDGKEYGPVGLDQLKEWIAAGRVNGQIQVSTTSGGSEELRKTDSEGFDANAPEHLKLLGPYVQATRVLVCPSDNSKHAAPGFDALQAVNVSYRLRTAPSVALTNVTETLATCPIHGTKLLCDTSVVTQRKPVRRSGP